MSVIAYGMDAAIEQDRDNKPKLLAKHLAPVSLSLSSVL